MGFQHYFEEKIIWFKHLTPHSFPNKKINNLFWSKFLFSYTYYMEPACFITLFHVWPQVLVQILSWWEVCLLAMISLVSKAWSLLSFANDSLKNAATFYVNNYFIDWLMNVYYFFGTKTWCGTLKPAILDIFWQNHCKDNSFLLLDKNLTTTD